MARRDHVDLGSSSPKRIDSDGLTSFKKNFYQDPKNSGLKHAQKPLLFLFGTMVFMCGGTLGSVPRLRLSVIKTTLVKRGKGVERRKTNFPGVDKGFVAQVRS